VIVYLIYYLILILLKKDGVMAIPNQLQNLMVEHLVIVVPTQL